VSLTTPYDPQNIFAQIIRGDAPCYKLYEDDDVLAFLDLFPQSFGHTLVIPKRSAACNILDVDTDALAKVMAVVQKLTRVIVDELQPDGVQVAQFNGAPAGQTVFHIHVHIVPRYSGEGSVFMPPARPIRPIWKSSRRACSSVSPRRAEPGCDIVAGSSPLRPSQQPTGTKVQFVPGRGLRTLRA